MCSSGKVFLLIALIGITTTAWCQSTYLLEYEGLPLLFPEQIVSSLDGSYVASFGRTIQDQKFLAYYLQTDATGGYAGGKLYRLTGNAFEAKAAVATSDAGYILVGTSGESFGDSESFALKVSGTGSIEWKKRYPATGQDDIRKILEVPDGYLLVGSRHDGQTPYAKLLLMGIDRLGNLKWKRAIEARVPSVGLVGFGVQSFGHGGALVSSVYGDSLLLVNAGSGGRVLWARKYNAPRGYDFGSIGSITGTADSGLLITAAARNIPAGHDGIGVVRIDAAGKPIWARFFTTPLGRFLLQDVSGTADHGVAMVGTVWNPEKSYSKAFAAKITDQGTLQWKRLFDRYDRSELSGVTALPDGTIAASGSGSLLSLLVRLSHNGEILGTCDRYVSFPITVSKLEVSSAQVALNSLSLPFSTATLSVKADDLIKVGTEVCAGFAP